MPGSGEATYKGFFEQGIGFYGKGDGTVGNMYLKGDAELTANFGTGWIGQWSTFTDKHKKAFTVRPPLRTGSAPYRFVEFDYAPATAVVECGDEPSEDMSSRMTLQRTAPHGYRMFDITKGADASWMSIRIRSLAIGQSEANLAVARLFGAVVVLSATSLALFGLTALAERRVVTWR